MGLIDALGLKPAKNRPAVATPQGPAGSGPAGPAVDPATALDARLGQDIDALTALLDQVHDDAAAAPARAELQKLIDGRAKAAGLAAAARIAALNTLRAAAARQKPQVQALLAHAQALERREAARKEIEVALGQVTALVLGGIHHDSLRDGINAELKKAQAGYDKADKLANLAAAEKAFVAQKPGVLDLLARAEQAKALTDRLDAAVAGLDAKLAAAAANLGAMGADAPAPLAARLAPLQARRAKGWNAGADRAAIEASAAAFTADVEALAGDVDAARKAWDARKSFEAAWAALRPLADEAEAIRAGAEPVLSGGRAYELQAARRLVDTAVAAGDWAKAQAALPALKRLAEAAKKSAAEARAFNAAYAPLRADTARARAALSAPGLPSAPGAALKAALQALDTATTARDWPKASAALPPLQKALKDALEALDDGQRFYAAFAPLRLLYEQAQLAQWHPAAQSDVRITGRAAQFRLQREQLEEKIAQADWRPAERMLPDIERLARALVEATRFHDGARKTYDQSRAALRDLDKAEAAVTRVTPVTEPLVQAFKQARTAVADAEHAGAFGDAMVKLTAWQQAIDALVAGDAAQAQAKLAFQAAFDALTNYAEATQVAAAPLPALAADAQAFKAAEQRIAAARETGRWTDAKDAVADLQAAADRLAAGSATVNANATPQDFAGFDQRLHAFDPRLAKAAQPVSGPWLEGLQKTVQGRREDIDAAVAAQDLAAAESALARLPADLAALEQGLQREAAHRKRFEAARAGEIAAARALALAPPALAAERDGALAATETAITTAAGRGEFDRAAALIDRWQLEARGWKESQAAYAELHGGKVPKVAALEALAKKPGGEQVLDALILKMPASTPAKVLNAALKARYGFEIKRFTNRNTDETDLKGLQAHDPEQPDPELVQVYKLLAQIPSKQIKGKIEEMVDYDVDQNGGVYYPNKKIYLYSGRVGQTADGVKSLGDDVMPEGEEVDERCKPDTSTPPVPVSNFTLLHEAAHAEDRGTGYMDGKKGAANTKFGGWVDESPKSIAIKAAKHFGYDEDYIRATLEDKNGKPPEHSPSRPKDVKDDIEWNRRRLAALDWCGAIRAKAGPWWKGAVCKQIAIDGRVYQESYDDGRWTSYDYAARAQGISGYQFRAAPEWFAELYAAFFSGKLKPSHPAMEWLKAFKPPQP